MNIIQKKSTVSNVYKSGIEMIFFISLSIYGAETKYYYDAAGRLFKTEYSSGNLIEYEYDDASNIVEIKTTTANPSPPKIKTQPSSINAVSGQKVIFAVVAEGSGLKYQWQKDKADIPGADSANFAIEAVTSDDSGDYNVVVSNDYGVVKSSTATLTVVQTTGILKMAVSKAEGGTTVPASGSTTNLEFGKPQAISAIANPGYSFIYWSVIGNASLDDIFSENAIITLKDNSTATANFAETASTSTLNMMSDPVDGGNTVPAISAILKNNDEISIQAIPADGFYFVEWISDVEITHKDFNPTSAKTKISISKNTNLTANFARKSPISETVKNKMTVAIKMENSTDKSGNPANKDSVKISSMPLGAQFPAENFNTDLLTAFMIDGEQFKFNGGSWTGKKGKWSFKTDKNTTPKIIFSINTSDAKNPVCSFSASGLGLTQLDNTDGIDIYIVYNNKTYGANLAMNEKSSWKFDSSKNKSELIQNLTLPPMKDFGIDKSSGAYASLKKSKNGIPQNKDSFNIPGATFDTDFKSDTDNVIFTADNFSKVIPAGAFVNKKGNVFVYESKAEGLKMLLDFDKNAWTLKLSANDNSGISASNGIDIILSIGAKQSGIKIFPIHKTKLSYPK